MRPDRPTNFARDTTTGDGVGLPPASASKSLAKPKRKPIPVRVQVAVAIRQANKCEQFGCSGFTCALCGTILASDEPRILEHMTPHATMVALGKDPDAIDNLRWVHKACADRKTNGTKATTAGSDKHMIAKGRRFDKINAGERSRKRKWPPMKSKPFPKVHRPFGGVKRG